MKVEILDVGLNQNNYSSAKKVRGRKPIVFVELHLDYCGNTFGTSPCTASGTPKCFNTFASCQDKPNFTKETKIYRFCENLEGIPVGLEAFPALKSVDLAPQKLKVGGIGTRASVSVTLRDFPHHDRGIDPYVSERSYTPFDQGTFFGKLRSRNPFYVNRKLVIKTGFIEDDFDFGLEVDFEERTYFIESFSMPDAKGNVKIVAKDILKLANGDKSQAPLPSDGVLLNAITDTDTSLTLASGYTTTYADSGTIRINDEIMTYTGKSGDELTGLTRAQHNTEAAEHDVDDSVQVCLTYERQDAPTIMQDLLVNYAEVPSEYILLQDWIAEASEKVSIQKLTGIISEPTAVVELVEDVLESTLSYIWWDDVDTQIKYRAGFPITQRDRVTAFTDESNLIEDKTTVKDVEKMRVSQLHYYYNRLNPTEGMDKDNFRSIYVRVDTDAESENEYGVKSIKEIKSRFVTEFETALAVGGRTFTLYKDIIKEVQFYVDAKDSELKAGEFVTLTTRLIQDWDGSQLTKDFIVTEREETTIGSIYRYKALEFALRQKVGFITPDDMVDHGSATDKQKNDYGFIALDTGLMPDGSDAYTIA